MWHFIRELHIIVPLVSKRKMWFFIKDIIIYNSDYISCSTTPVVHKNHFIEGFQSHGPWPKTLYAESLSQVQFLGQEITLFFLMFYNFNNCLLLWFFFCIWQWTLLVIFQKKKIIIKPHLVASNWERYKTLWETAPSETAPSEVTQFSSDKDVLFFHSYLATPTTNQAQGFTSLLFMHMLRYTKW